MDNANDAAFLMVYMTAADRDEARKIASALVERRLAACVNIFGVVESVYRWEGEIRRAEEIALTAKTAPECFDALAACVRELHSYTIPCVVALPLARGEADFLRWIGENTRRGGINAV
jgi:periplasmic divalent cation tolerance protein